MRVGKQSAFLGHLVKAWSLVGTLGVVTGQVAEISLTGETVDETEFEGSDELNLILRGKALRQLLDELF